MDTRTTERIAHLLPIMIADPKAQEKCERAVQDLHLEPPDPLDSYGVLHAGVRSANRGAKRPPGVSALPR